MKYYSMVLSVFSYKSIKFTEEVILGTLLVGATLQGFSVIDHWNREEQHYGMGWLEVTFSGLGSHKER